MKTQHDEMEIGALIAELDEMGYHGMKIDVDDSESPRARYVTAYAWICSEECAQKGTGNDVISALASLVDTIRAINGLPSREQELAAALAADQAIHNIQCFDKCLCGSKRPLKLKREVLINIPWDGSAPQCEPVGEIKAGEIAKCPECGQYFRLG